MKKKLKIIIPIIIIILVIAGILIYKFLWKKPSTEKPPVTNITNVTNKIEKYGYTLDDRDSPLFKEKYEELKNNLEKETIDESEYAKILSELFIIDLYTMDNKINQYDIGGLEYMYPDSQESFRSIILDTIYKTVEDNSYKTRKQKLPIVELIEVVEVKQSTYTIAKEKIPSYEVSLKWSYKEDLGFDVSGTVTLIKNDIKLNIIRFEPSK